MAYSQLLGYLLLNRLKKLIMEFLYFTIVSSAIAYAIHLLQQVDKRIDNLEKKILIIELSLPKRRTDKKCDTID